MFNIQSSRPWNDRPRNAPPILDEETYIERRALLKALGFGGLIAALPSAACGFTQDPGNKSDGAKATSALDSYPTSARWVPKWEPAGGVNLYPAKRNAEFKVGRLLTPEDTAAKKNNYYEFLPNHAGEVYRYTDKFEARPWQVEIAGEVEEPRRVDIDEIAKIAPLEERIYRHRCVEAWSMVVPWTGVPMAAFVDWCKPKSSAKYLKFTSFLRPEQAPGQKSEKQYAWPYYEGLRIDEARNPIALIGTGIFGHGLPAQHGAPIRVITPWKYGYKSAKAFVKVEFVKDEPKTFWNDIAPKEYSFLSNVDPSKRHPRWSQAHETDIATGDKIPTLYYNGYEEFVGKLYTS